MRENNLPINDVWNVIDEERFKERVRFVFNQVAGALVKTLGPFGSTTIIEKFGEMHITKDGWQVLKKIFFADPINRNIMQLLINISAQVVIKVGDGSTSSIMAANSILEQLESSEELKSMRPKEFMKILSNCVKNISDKIIEHANVVEKGEGADFEEIYNLAKISTNGDDVIPGIIQSIYKETKNPSIEFLKSKTNATYYEIVNGYKMNISYLDAIYTNNDDGTCVINEPIILMFDHKLEDTQYQKVILPAIQVALTENRRVVVIAPNYDRYLLQKIKFQQTNEMKATGQTTVVFTHVSLINNLFNNFYSDFCMLTGGLMVTESTIMEIMEGTESFDINQYIGRVGKITIGPSTTNIQNFFNRNENTYKLHCNDATAKYTAVAEKNKELGIVTTEVYDLKQRVAKLNGRMGIIYVGGSSSLEKTSNWDLVDDAVKACESAFNYGYNIGGNLIIPIMIDRILETQDVDDNQYLIYQLLSEAFRDVFRHVLSNKYQKQLYTKSAEMVKQPKENPFIRFFKVIFGWGQYQFGVTEKDKSNEFIEEIIDKCITDWTCYDLVDDRYSRDIINSCYTDIEILRAATSIVSLLISSNQYISISIDGESDK